MPPPISITMLGGRTAVIRIGLIVRGKQGFDHHPDKLDQHADCILVTGEPIGFFGDRDDTINGHIGMGIPGVVYDYERMQRERPYYTDLDAAVACRVVSTAVLIDVTMAVASYFTAAWDEMKLEPGDFNIIGGNCATHASAAFIKAGILQSAIPWMDTPDNLFHQITDTLPASRLTVRTGFFGFEPSHPGLWDVKLEPYRASQHANAPRPPAGFSFGING